jgi:hypothetical protein
LKLRYINEFIKKFGDYEIFFELVDTPLEECFKRNALRTRRVDESVIKEQFSNLKNLKRIFDFKTRYPNLVENNLHDKQDCLLPRCFIFDIDGTLASMHNRGPFDWKKVGNDRCKIEIAVIARALQEDYKIIICTGRDGSCVEETKKWLHEWCIPFDELYIRKEGDCRTDYVVKEEMWKDIIKKYYVIAMFDDRNQVVNHARKLGFTVLQVAEGDF